MGFAKNSLCVFLASVMLASSVLSRSSHDMSRIVGGTLAPGPLPYQVSLFSGSTHFCGGALISRQTVLTAASCFTSVHLTQPPNVGVLAASTTGVSSDGITANVFSIDIHPNYTDATRANDIAVVTLTSAYNNSVVGVAPLTLGTTEVPVQTACSVSGWGGRTSAEQTDLGGPLVCNNVLSGILSWGLHCAAPNPTVFTNTIPFNSWIETTRILRETAAGNGAETVLFSSLLLPVLILLNSYLSL